MKIQKKEEEAMKSMFILMTLLVAMITGAGTAMASVPTTVPEPTSMLLVAAGLLGVAGISIRRKK